MEIGESGCVSIHTATQHGITIEFHPRRVVAVLLIGVLCVHRHEPSRKRFILDKGGDDDDKAHLTHLITPVLELLRAVSNDHDEKAPSMDSNNQQESTRATNKTQTQNHLP